MRVLQALMAVCLFAMAVDQSFGLVVKDVPLEDKEGAKIQFVQDSPAKVEDSPAKEEVAAQDAIAKEKVAQDSPVKFEALKDFSHSLEAVKELKMKEILERKRKIEKAAGDEEEEDQEQKTIMKRDYKSRKEAEWKEIQERKRKIAEAGGDEEEEDQEQIKIMNAVAKEKVAQDSPVKFEALKDFPYSLVTITITTHHVVSVPKVSTWTTTTKGGNYGSGSGYSGHISGIVPKSLGCSKSRDGGNWGKSFDRAGWSKCHRGNNYISGFLRSSQGWFGEDRIGRLEEARCCKASWIFRGQQCKNTNWVTSFNKKNHWNSCPKNYYLHGLKTSNGKGLHNIEMAHCCKPTNSQYGNCYTQDIRKSFDKKGWSACLTGYSAVGLYRSSCDKLHCIEKIKCCQMAVNGYY